MAKAKKISRREFQKILNESVVDPRALGPLQVIADVGNENYLINRSIEILRSMPVKGTDRLAELTKVITLLTLAKVEILNGTVKNQVEKRPRSNNSSVDNQDASVERVVH